MVRLLCSQQLQDIAGFCCSCIYLQDTSNFIDLTPLIVWILRVNGRCLKLVFVRPLSVSLGGDKKTAFH